MVAEWTPVDSWRVRDVYDGSWWTVAIARCDGPRFRALATHEPTGAYLLDDGDWVSGVRQRTPKMSRRRATRRAESMTANIGARLLHGEWVLCESERSVEGLPSVPWPGPCTRPGVHVAPKPMVCR